MMTLAILPLEDEANVHEALGRDLDDFWRHVRLEVADDANDAWSAAEDVVANGDKLAVVLSDYRLPGESGIGFLVELVKDPRFPSTRMALVTGRADQDDTICTLNEAGLDHYIAKPWDPMNLQEVVRHQLTDFVLEAGINPLPYPPVLDDVRVMETIRQARCEGLRGDVGEARRERSVKRWTGCEFQGVASSSGAFRGETIV